MISEYIKRGIFGLIGFVLILWALGPLGLIVYPVLLVVLYVIHRKRQE